MNTFPTLRTGAVLQYPSKRAIQYSTQVVRFVDGTEQRFRDYSAPIHRWIVSLSQLDETEVNTLREFFRILEGGAESFSFTDPFDGTVYPDCSLESDMREGFAFEANVMTSFVVKENRT